MPARPSPPPSTRARVFALLVVLSLSLLALGVRAAWIQVREGPALRRLARGQQLQEIEIPARRGRILDRHGRELAINVEADSAFAIPTAIRDPERFARRVAPILGIPAEEIRARLDPDRYFAWLGRKLPPETAARLRALGEEGEIGFEREDRRAYPKGDLAAAVVGFVGIDNQGLAGAELAFDSLLRGTPGSAVVTRDAVGRELVDGRRVLRAPSPGHDVVLTIDEVIQHVAERELARALKRYRATSAAAVVLDPRTGEVLALASLPGFDPATASRLPPERWVNRPISWTYEPGSTFKLVTATAALDSGAVTSDDVFACAGVLKVPGGYVIRDAHGVKHGDVRLRDILAKSCNVGAAQVGTRVGRERLYQAIRRFKFGSTPRIGLPGEEAGIVPPPSAWLGPGLQTISIGQGVAATPLQVALAYAAVANGGVMMRPRIARVVLDADGRAVRTFAPETAGVVTAPATAALLRRMLVATTEEGTGIEAAVSGYRVAGKTGTSQKPSPRGGYDPDRHIASFVGLVPAADPRLVIVVVVDEPRGAIYGGTVAAPVFREIAARALWYLRVPPTEQVTTGGESRPRGQTGE